VLTKDPRSLLQLDTWKFLAKLSVILTIEGLLAPGMIVLVLSDGILNPRAVLMAQNILRRRALLWMFPEFGGSHQRSGEE
jgi:hypothetical protein